MTRLLYDLTGLLHWYAYFRRPAGVQRVIEQIGGSATLQEAARRSPSSGTRVEFVFRLLGSDQFCRLDPALLPALLDRRHATVALLRRLFAQSMRLTTAKGILAEARYFHTPYIALGLTRTERLPGRLLGRPEPSPAAILHPTDPPAPGDAYFNPGDLWWQKNYGPSLAGLKQRTGVRIIQMIHDLYVLQRPDWSPAGFSKVFADQFRGIAPHVDGWLTSSAHVRQQVLDRLEGWSLPTRPIAVLPMGWDSFERERRADPAADRAILDRRGIGRRPFILFVGTVEPRKNLPLLLDAVEALRRRLGERVPALVVAGGYGWRAGDVRRRLRQSVAEGHLVWVRNSSDEELGALYRNARFTVMPSHGEGWGLAVQESIALGVPCIASSGGATREAGGDLAIYVDPGQPEQLEAAMASLIASDAALADARARIEQALRTRAFATWNDAAKVLLAQAFAPQGSGWL